MIIIVDDTHDDYIIMMIIRRFMIFPYIMMINREIISHVTDHQYLNESWRMIDQI